ncbi:MAG: M15 family metallopeptidase [Treponema sp.]|jgi:hypothetical protein|nr:M15 family metallopeptidase [Treponema sp.]
MLLWLFLSAVQAFCQNFGRTANGELALRAFQTCFPDKAGAVSFVENDWAITADGETFFWAGGRLLPRAEKANVDNWEPHFFGVYPEKTASPDAYPPLYIEILRNRGNEEIRLDRKDCHHAFQGILYGGLERKEVEAQLLRLDFLGGKVTVHRDIAEALRRIDAAVGEWDGGKAFIDSIASIGGYNWREIAGTRRMSYHSWGLAIDIQPKRLGGKAIYWQWERRRTKDWMLVPLESRWNPPDPVIKAFENEGFIWGGKWPFYDNMHFEYRPELHEFNRLLAVSPYNANGSPGQELHHIAPDFLLR